MALRNPTKEKAEDFIEKIEQLLARKDGIIYKKNSRIKRPNVISVETAGSYDAIVTVTFYNVVDPATVLDPYDWKWFGEIGAEVDIRTYNDPVIEFSKRFD